MALTCVKVEDAADSVTGFARGLAGFWRLRGSGELSAALNLSGVKLHQKMNADQVAELVISAVARYGEAWIRRQSERNRELNSLMLSGEWTPEERAERRAFWTERQARLCTDLVSKLIESDADFRRG